MKFFFIFIFLNFQLLFANAQRCDRAISWKDANYLKRSERNGAVSSMAEWRLYGNAEWMQTNFDGRIESMIRLKNGIRLFHANDNSKPSEFAEIGLAVESPMWSAGKNMFPNIGIPCQLREYENTPVAQHDLNLDRGQGNHLPKVYGNLRRQGMRVTYAIEIQRGKSDDQLDSWYGTWEYDANLKNFPSAYDVRGWKVYRGDVFLEQIAIDRRVPFSEILTRY